MTRDEVNMLKDIAEITAEVAALRAENKCLREDRDAWKEYAMRSMPPMPTVAAAGEPHGKV
jgi:cell division protein FtsB